MLGVERSCRSARSVADAWNRSALAPGRDATKTTYTADLDPASEDIVVEYDKATTSAGFGLRRCRPRRRRAVAGGRRPDDPLNDTPKGGHWGGARITSATKNCTAGFSVVRKRSTGQRGSVTAGHCGGKGTIWRSGTQLLRHHDGPHELPRLRPGPGDR